jgi:hypothetical protein
MPLTAAAVCELPQGAMQVMASIHPLAQLRVISQRR